MALALLQAPGRLRAGVVQAPAQGGPRLLPRATIISLNAVTRYFSDIASESSSGPDATALGRPLATRAVIYSSPDGARRVTVSVDQYSTAGDASSAYQQAVVGSQVAPGFNLLPAPDLGEQAYAGTSSNRDETHVGLGALDRNLIVAATIAGYDAGPNNIANLVALAREEIEAARTALGANGGS